MSSFPILELRIHLSQLLISLQLLDISATEPLGKDYEECDGQ
jgi:hypothetical protein